MEEKVREVLIAAIEVVSNPRKRFDDEKLQSLAESIQRDGLVQPILVRPLENGAIEGRKGFELVAGERRLRAHLLLGRDMIPSTIREMDAKQAARIRLVENLHREDLHELDEAQAFQELLEDEAYTVPMLAAECGRSESYVYQRLKLLDLVDEARGAFAAGEIPAAHAMAIARLKPEDQAAALKFATEGWNGPPSTSQLQGHIANHILLQLKGAPFDPEDAELVPKAGPCTTCPKRTGNIPGLWPELEGEDRCTDRPCFEAKRDAAIPIAVANGVVPVVEGWNEEPPDDYPAALTARRYTRLHDYSVKCKGQEEAIAVAGHGAGARFMICRSPDCPRHGRGGRRKLTDQEKLDRARQKERTRRAAEVTDVLREKIVERVEPNLQDSDQLRALIRLTWERLYHEAKVALCKSLGFEGKERQYGSGRDYEGDFRAWIDGQTRDELLGTHVRLLLLFADPYTSSSWESLSRSHLADVAAAFGYQYHNAVRSVRAAAEVELPEDSA